MQDTVKKVRAGSGPVFIESRITRWRGNYSSFPNLIGGPFQLEWIFDPKSAPKELRAWISNDDPVSLSVRSLVKDGSLTRRKLQGLDKKVCEEVEAAAEFALASPEPRGKDALQHVFA